MKAAAKIAAEREADELALIKENITVEMSVEKKLKKNGQLAAYNDVMKDYIQRGVFKEQHKENRPEEEQPEGATKAKATSEPKGATDTEATTEPKETTNKKAPPEPRAAQEPQDTPEPKAAPQPRDAQGPKAATELRAIPEPPS